MLFSTLKGLLFEVILLFSTLKGLLFEVISSFTNRGVYPTKPLSNQTDGRYRHFSNMKII